MTGVSDITDIVHIFVGLQESNFSLLTYINELDKGIEEYEVRNRELQEAINAKELREEHCEKNFAAKTANLQADFDNVMSMIEEQDQKKKQLQRVLNAVYRSASKARKVISSNAPEPGTCEAHLLADEVPMLLVNLEGHFSANRTALPNE